MAVISQKTLLSRYRQLPDAHKIVLQLCSVIYCGASRTTIHSCLDKIKDLLPEKTFWPSKQTEKYLKILTSQKLLRNKNEHHELIVDALTRDAEDLHD